MKLHQFRDIVAIAKHGSVRAAARHLNLAQPALTRSLGALERELGTPLFERGARGLLPTPIGHTFLRRAATILNEVRNAQDEAEQLRGGVGGQVVLGLSMAAHIAFLPELLRPFRQRYAAARLQVIEATYPALEAGLRDGSVDFYVGPVPEERIPAALMQELLFANTRAVLCRRGHPRAGAKSLRDLADAEWASTSLTLHAEDEFAELFGAHGMPPPRLLLRCQSAMTLMVALANSDLLALVPIQWSAFGPAASTLTCLDLRETLPAPDVVIIRRAGIPLTPAATFVMDLIGKQAAAIAAPPPPRRLYAVGATRGSML